MTRIDRRLATGSFSDPNDQRGWAILHAESNKALDDRLQAGAIGYLEGAATAHMIWYPHPRYR